MKFNLVDPIVNTFLASSKKPDWVAQKAERFENVEEWVKSQKNAVSWMGALTMVVPGIHFVAMLFDFGFLLRRMAHTCWGIAQQHECELTDHGSAKVDLAIILAHWSGALDDSGLEHAIFFENTPDRLDEGALIAGASHQFAKVLLRRLVVQNTYGALGGKAAAKVLTKVMPKLSLKFFVKAGIKILGNFFIGIIPLFGVIATVALNRYFVSSIARSADKYYSIVKEHSQYL